MSAKQSSAGLLCRCIYCHGIFKLFSYHTENDTDYSEFECDCGRVIRVKEKKTRSASKIDESSIVPFLSEEVTKDG